MIKMNLAVKTGNEQAPTANQPASSRPSIPAATPQPVQTTQAAVEKPGVADTPVTDETSVSQQADQTPPDMPNAQSPAADVSESTALPPKTAALTPAALQDKSETVKAVTLAKTTRTPAPKPAPTAQPETDNPNNAEPVVKISFPVIGVIAGLMLFILILLPVLMGRSRKR
jgi:hypothetical protein